MFQDLSLLLALSQYDGAHPDPRAPGYDLARTPERLLGQVAGPRRTPLGQTMSAVLALGMMVWATAAARCEIGLPFGDDALLTGFQMADISVVDGGLRLRTEDLHSMWFRMLDAYDDLGQYDRLEIELRAPRRVEFLIHLGVRSRPHLDPNVIEDVRFWSGDVLDWTNSTGDGTATIPFEKIPGFDGNVSSIYDLTLSNFRYEDDDSVTVDIRSMKYIGDGKCRHVIEVNVYTFINSSI